MCIDGRFQINLCSAGIANRQASIRIPLQVAEDQCGYLEDRRPASNCDPYDVTDIIVRTVCLREKDPSTHQSNDLKKSFEMIKLMNIYLWIDGILKTTLLL